MRHFFKQFDRAKARNSVFIFLVFMLLGLFQNCSKGFAVKSDATGALTTSQSSSSGAVPSAVSATSPGDCTFDGKSISNGTTVNAYVTSAVPFGQSCDSQIEARKCQNGVLSGSASYSSCGVGVPAACLFNDTVNGTINPMTVASSKSITAWQTSSVKYGQSCVSETRACTNGTLSGSFTNSSCHEPVLKKIVSGSNEACALIDDSLKCWGEATNGAYTFLPGVTNYGTPSSPALVFSSGVTDVSVRAFGYACAILNGSLNCSGSGSWGTNPPGVFHSLTLVKAGVKKFASSLFYTCALGSTGLECWDVSSSLTQGVLQKSVVIDLSQSDQLNLSDLTVTGDGGCAIVANGAVKCWNFTYPLASASAPVQIISSGATKLSSQHGGSYCAIVNTSLYCWNWNVQGGEYFALADGSSSYSITPILVTSGVVDVSMAANGATADTCVVKSDTSAQCFGAISSSQGYPYNPTYSATVMSVGVARVDHTIYGNLVLQMVDGSVMASTQTNSSFVKINLGL